MLYYISYFEFVIRNTNACPVPRAKKHKTSCSVPYILPRTLNILAVVVGGRLLAASVRAACYHNSATKYQEPNVKKAFPTQVHFVLNVNY